MTDHRPGLRERKNERTQRAIIEATLRLTLEQGFEATTVAAIAEQADVASRTFAAAVMGVLVGQREMYLTEPDPSEAAEQLEAGLAFLRGGVSALRHATDGAP